MQVSLSFSGGCGHVDVIPDEQQKAHANKIVNEISEVLKANHLSGGISISLGTQTAAGHVTATTTLDEPKAKGEV